MYLYIWSKGITKTQKTAYEMYKENCEQCFFALRSVSCTSPGKHWTCRSLELRVRCKTSGLALNSTLQTKSSYIYVLCSLVCEDEKQATAVKSQLQQLARPMYSNPPVHGALIVSTVLGDPGLKKLWLKEVKVTCQYIPYSPVFPSEPQELSRKYNLHYFILH